MAAAVAGAAIGAVGNVISGAIQAGTERANVKDTLVNNIQLQTMRGQNNLDVQQTANSGMRDVATINTQSSQYVQQQQFAQASYIRSNLQKSLEEAGLPGYLAFIQPDESLMQTRQVRGLNFAQYYPGQKYRRAIY